MANDIDGLTSSETVSQPCRAGLPRNEPDRRSEYTGSGPPAAMNSDSVTDDDMAHVNSENQDTDSTGTMANGCTHHHHHHHHDIEEGIYSPASSRDENCSVPSAEPIVYSGGSDDTGFSHDFVPLSEVSETAATDSRNSSTKTLAKECVTPECACTGDQMLREFAAKEVGKDIGGNNDTEAVDELFASITISNDLPEVPLDVVSDERLHAAGEEPCGSKRRSSSESSDGIEYVMYESEKQMPDIMSLITKDLSEPYSIYTYRYFIHNWPNLCFLALHQSKCVGAIVCKLDTHKKVIKRGYIAMLAVAQDYRKRGIGSHLVIRAIKGMVADGCDEVVLETEITNQAALHLYENLGFVRDKRLFRYYLNGVDALRLKLWLK